MPGNTGHSALTTQARHLSGVRLQLESSPRRVQSMHENEGLGVSSRSAQSQKLHIKISLQHPFPSGLLAKLCRLLTQAAGLPPQPGNMSLPHVCAANMT